MPEEPGARRGRGQAGRPDPALAVADRGDTEGAADDGGDDEQPQLAERRAPLEQRRAEVLTATQALAAVQAEQRNAQRNVDDAGNRLARMEGDRDRLVVIIAGYDGEIDRFLAANDGLASRFARRIGFESYSPAEQIGRASCRERVSSPV